MPVNQYTDNLNLLYIQETDKFIDETFNNVLDDADKKLLGVAHATAGGHWDVWEATTAYSTGDIVRYPSLKGNQYVKCIKGGTSGSDIPTVNVTGTTFADGDITWQVMSLSDIADGNSETLSVWLADTVYRRGAIVLYNQTIYRCRRQHQSASTFESDYSDWQMVYASLKDYTTRQFYPSGALVLFNGSIYKALDNITSATSIPSYLDESEWQLLGMSKIKEWTNSDNYVENQVVRVGNRLYVSVDNHKPDSLDEFSDDRSHWSALGNPINDWATDTYYEVDDLVYYDNYLYRSKSTHTSGTGSFEDDMSNWTRIQSRDSLTWEQGHIYSVGDIVVASDSSLYTCSQSHIASDFLAQIANWEKLVGESGSGISIWESSKEYKENDVVLYSDELYLCLGDHTSSTFDADSSYWKKLSFSQSDLDNTIIKNSGGTFDVGDILLQWGRLYVCTTAYDATDTGDTWKFVVNNWKEISVAGITQFSTASYTSDITVKKAPDKYNGTDNSTGTEINPNEIYRTFDVGDLITYNGVLYVCNSATDNTALDLTKWDEVSSGSGGSDNGGLVEWSANTAYKEGQIVRYNKLVYKVTQDVLSGATFSTDHLSLINLGYVEDWDSNTVYEVDEVVMYNKVLYRCNTRHQSATAFDTSKSYWDGIISSEEYKMTIEEWQSGTRYVVNSVVYYADTLYISNISHTSSSSFINDMVTGSEKWRILNATSLSGWYQVNKADVEANTVVSIPIGKTTSYLIPPVEILKFEEGQSAQESSVYTFDEEDKADFNESVDYADFDGVAKLANTRAYSYSESLTETGEYFYVSDEIDLNVFDTVEEVS